MIKIIKIPGIIVSISLFSFFGSAAEQDNLSESQKNIHSTQQQFGKFSDYADTVTTLQYSTVPTSKAYHLMEGHVIRLEQSIPIFNGFDMMSPQGLMDFFGDYDFEPKTLDTLPLGTMVHILEIFKQTGMEFHEVWLRVSVMGSDTSLGWIQAYSESGDNYCDRPGFRSCDID